MDRFDREILDFMRSWAPYGGPPTDQALEEFGLTRDELIERVRLIVATEAARREHEQQRPWLRLQNTAPATDTKTSTKGH